MPMLNRNLGILNVLTEYLIWFSVIFAPWAFASVHKTPIFVLNLINTSIGIIMIFNFIRKSNSQRRKFTTRKKNSKLLFYFDRIRILKLLSVGTLIYILISILNYRSDFDDDLKVFTNYNPGFINWLPHTYSKSQTINMMWNYIGLAFAFWGLYHLLVDSKAIDTAKVSIKGNYDSDSERFGLGHLFIPRKAQRLFWLLCINGGFIALVSIIQRIDNSNKLLWVYERSTNLPAEQSLGPFGYRGNGSAYLNMILPLYCPLIVMVRNKFRTERTPRIKIYYFLLIVMFLICLICQFFSLSRGGIVSLLLIGSIWSILILVKKVWSDKISWYKILLKYFTILVFCVVVFGNQIVTQVMSQRNFWYESQFNETTSEDILKITFKIPPPPFKFEQQLFLITNSRKQKFIKELYTAKILKDGSIRVVLENAKTHEFIEKIYYIDQSFYEQKVVTLRLNRTNKGLQARLNDIAIFGHEQKTGLNPPLWNLPILADEFLIRSQPDPESGIFGYECLSFNFQPTAVRSGNSQRNFALSFESFLNPTSTLLGATTRWRIYDMSISILTDFLYMGCGAGSWSAVYFLYQDIDEERAAWAHCDLLEYLTTFGIIGSSFGLGIIFIVLFSNVKCKRSGLPITIQTGVNFAICSCLFHSLYDFPLQVLSTMHLFVILCSLKMVIYRSNTTIKTLNFRF